MNIYHLSQNNLDGKILSPRIPSNFLTKNGYENNKTKRVCFAKSIDGCLRGMSQNLKGMKFYVHIPEDTHAIYTPTLAEVPDCKVTGEVWIKEPVKLKCIGMITVSSDKGEDGIPYTYGNNTAELYDWNWKWEKINESYTLLSDVIDDVQFVNIMNAQLLESNLINEKDILYNKEKFDSGEINLCFITGHSGSGKSTMGRNMSSNKVEHYELDDLNTNYKFTDDQLKEYGDLIYSYFKGPGKKYRYTSFKDMQNCTNPLDDSGDEYDKCINTSFIKYAINYAKSHKNTKFVIEGIWLYFFIKPEELKDYAVYIKGTSKIVSAYRAAKRDSQDEKNIIKRFIYTMKGTIKSTTDKFRADAERNIQKYRNYYSKLENEKDSVKNINESYDILSDLMEDVQFVDIMNANIIDEGVASTIDKDFKSKGNKSLSSFKRVHITESVISKYKKEYPFLKHVRCKDTKEYICDGYIWFDNDELVGMVGSCEYRDDKTKWVVSLEITKEYRGYGLSKQILDYAVNTMKCKYLSVNKNNEIAKRVYDKYGFKVYHESELMYYMTIDKNAVSLSESYDILSDLMEDVQFVDIMLNTIE